MPLPTFHVGFSGQFDKILFLPQAHPRVVAWQVSWFQKESPLQTYIYVLQEWLKENGFKTGGHKEFLPHVTLCRAPFDYATWKKEFHKLPLMLKSLHLYESLGQLQYKPIWSHLILPPFEELEHTADIAFKIRGETVDQIYWHALTAMAFKMPELLDYAIESPQIDTVDAIIMQLNAIISRADTALGCMFKAVSLHGEIDLQTDGTLEWEMIVDV